MIKDKRWYVKHNATIDLSEVSSIITKYSYSEKYEYLITFKNGTAVPFTGIGLNTQFREYHNIEVEEVGNE